jgi:ribosomal protein S12 methylthiotransferase accessory factor
MAVHEHGLRRSPAGAVERSMPSAGMAVAADAGMLLIFPAQSTRSFCIDCFRITQDAIVDFRAGRAGPAVNRAPLEPGRSPNPFALECAAIALRQVDARPTEGGVAVDLVSGALVRFDPCLEPRCDPCLQAHGEPEVVDGSVRTKLGVGTYRTRALDDLPITPSKLANPFTACIGSRIWQRRDASCMPVTQGSFTVGASHARIHWYGTSRRFSDSAVVALIEGIERDAGTRPLRSGARLRATWRALGGRAIDPRRLGLYGDDTYEREHRLTRFSPDVLLDWSECTSARTGERKFIPADFVHYASHQLVFGNSSGCASGATHDEARLFALMELIERDAFLLHWHAGILPRRIRLQSVRDVECRTIVARIRSHGADVALLDLTLDLGVPVLMALATRPKSEFGAFSVATAAGMDPVAAARRALQELGVFQQGFPERSRQAAQTHLRDAPHDFSRVRNVEDHALLYGNPSMRPFAEFLLEGRDEVDFVSAFEAWERSKPATLRLSDDLAHVHHRLDGVGLQDVFYCDLTTPLAARMELRTVKAIVPGLLPIDFGHLRCRCAGLPRLGDVPRRLGLSSRRPLATTCAVPHPFS